MLVFLFVNYFDLISVLVLHYNCPIALFVVVVDEDGDEDEERR